MERMRLAAPKRIQARDSPLGGGLAVRRVYIHLVRCEVLVEQELVLETDEAANLQREVHIGGLHWRPLFRRGCRLMGRLSVLGDVGWIVFF